MPLLLPHTYEGLDGKIRSVVEDIVAKIQTWAAQVDGVNAAERLNELAGGIAGLSTAQPGFVQTYAGSSAPTGWLLCDGAAVSRTTYANLFAVVMTTYGVGDGVTTFNLPDLRGRFVLGKAASGTGSTLGSTGGSIDHTHTGPSHTHGAGSYQAPAHDHGGVTGDAQVYIDHMTLIKDSFTDDGTNQKDAVIDEAEDPHDHTIPTQAAATITGTSGAGGTGATGSANPPYMALTYIIKT
jgi:microcystin-dependent protein